MTARAGWAAVLLTGLAVALAGCDAGAHSAAHMVNAPATVGSDGGTQGHGHHTGGSNSPAPAPGGTQGHGSHGGGAGQLELWAVQSGPLGVVVTDGAGQLLYRSDRDTPNPPTSNCAAECAATWLPVTVADEQPNLLGVDASKIGTLRRADGATQLTLAGWPLYRRSGEPGDLQDAGSHGADGTWFAVTPTGEKATRR